MWHPDWAAVSNIQCFAALQILRTPFLEKRRWRLNCTSRSRRAWDAKRSGLQRQAVSDKPSSLPVGNTDPPGGPISGPDEYVCPTGPIRGRARPGGLLSDYSATPAAA